MTSSWTLGTKGGHIRCAGARLLDVLQGVLSQVWMLNRLQVGCIFVELWGGGPDCTSGVC